jgi:hypothetical protein
MEPWEITVLVCNPFGSGFGIGFTLTLLLARAPLLLASLLSHTVPFPCVH